MVTLTARLRTGVLEQVPCESIREQKGHGTACAKKGTRRRVGGVLGRDAGRYWSTDVLGSQAQVSLRRSLDDPCRDVVLQLQLKKPWKYFYDGGERAGRSGPPFRETGRQRRESAEGKSGSGAAAVGSLSCSRSQDAVASSQKPEISHRLPRGS